MPHLTPEREKRKYNSIWQVLNARNDIESKYKTIEGLVDGLLSQEVAHSLAKRDEEVREVVEKVRDTVGFDEETATEILSTLNLTDNQK